MFWSSKILTLVWQIVNGMCHLNCHISKQRHGSSNLQYVQSMVPVENFKEFPVSFHTKVEVNQEICFVNKYTDATSYKSVITHMKIQLTHDGLANRERGGKQVAQKNLTTKS